MRAFGRSLTVLMLVSLTCALATCAPHISLFNQITTLGRLRVATVNSASTYYLDGGGPAGFEYDLVEDFATDLGLKVDFLLLPDRQAVLDAVANGDAHLGVGLAMSHIRRRQVRFTPAYAASKLEAVYRVDQPRPADLAALSGQVTLPADTALSDWLRKHHPDLDFKVAKDANIAELMARIASGDLHATIANADIVAKNQRYYPSLRVAFQIPTFRQRKAWALTEQRANGLYDKAIAFLEATKADGRMRMLSDRYFGHAHRLGFVGGREFAKQVTGRLGRWQDYFQQAAAKYGLDWRLLAAIGYQESRWDKDAVSPTVVRGIMMLTRATASDLNVRDRRDPKQSIDGGARYFVELRKRLPDAIEEPDRTWFALAAYNAGYGHVMDARRLLDARGRNPNIWVNLRDALPWLTQERYLSHTRYGYADGLQAATYVGNIRAYDDILVWMSNHGVLDRSLAAGDDMTRTHLQETSKLSIASPPS